MPLAKTSFGDLVNVTISDDSPGLRKPPALVAQMPPPSGGPMMAALETFPEPMRLGYEKELEEVLRIYSCDVRRGDKVALRFVDVTCGEISYMSCIWL